MEANHPDGEINEEAFLRFGGSGHDRGCGPGSCTRQAHEARQADDEGRDGQASDAPPSPPPSSSPRDEEANDGQDVRRMALYRGHFLLDLLIKVMKPRCC
jgi:hypothetical protein